jgi:hypothetical protein
MGGFRSSVFPQASDEAMPMTVLVTMVVAAGLACAVYMASTRPCHSGWHKHRHWRHHHGHR